MEIIDFKNVLSKSLDIIDVSIKKGYFKEENRETLTNKLVKIFSNGIKYDIPGTAVYGQYMPGEQKLYYNAKVLKSEEEALIYILHEMKHGLDHTTGKIGFQDIENDKGVGSNEGATQRFATDLAEEMLQIKIPKTKQKSLGIELMTNLDEYQIEDKLNELFCKAIGVTKQEFILAQNQENKQLYNEMINRFNKYANFDKFNSNLDAIFKIQEETWIDKDGEILEIEAQPTEEQTQRAKDLIKKCQEQILQYVQKSNPDRLQEIKEELIMPINEYGEIVREGNIQNQTKTINTEEEKMSPRDMLYQFDYMNYQDFIMNRVDLGDNTLVFVSGLERIPFDKIFKNDDSLKDSLENGKNFSENIYVRSGNQYKKCEIVFDATGTTKISDFENIESTKEIIDSIEHTEVIGNAIEYIKLLKDKGENERAHLIEKKYENFLQNKESIEEIKQKLLKNRDNGLEQMMSDIRNGKSEGLSASEANEQKDENKIYKLNEFGIATIGDFKEVAEEDKSIDARKKVLEELKMAQTQEKRNEHIQGE